MNKTDISIIIVNYRVEHELFACLASIGAHIKGIKYEVIVIENDTKTNLTKKLYKYKFVKYIKTNENLGFGAGNNVGAKHASGEYLFFLNPDTEIDSGSLKQLLSQFSNKKIGIVSPLLLDKTRKAYSLQGTRKLTPIRALFSLSVVNKIWPNNPIARSFWLKNIDKSRPYEVDVVPGTALIISKKLFEKINGFDENFFLYFEENDLCDRVKALGYKMFINPSLKVIHIWGASTQHEKRKEEIFNKSRFYYFKKKYGIFIALLTTWLMEFNLKNMFLILIISLSVFLRFDRPYLSSFIPDQGWFYLSARDLLAGQIPLVGITSSHTWLHQGPFWTYLLALGLLINNFNPLAGNYIAAIFGVCATFMIYKVGSDFFTKGFGLMAALLYASSPLIIINERMGYHTAPISFFTALLLYFLLKWTRGSSLSFCVSIFILSILYNFELATVVFWPVIILLLVIGYRQKAIWFKKLLKKQIIILSLLSLVIPMIPVIIYDLGHEFAQTVKFGAWLLIYTPYKSLFKEIIHDPNFVSFTNLHLTRLIYLKSSLISWMVLGLSLIFIAFSSFKRITSPIGILFIFVLFPTLIYFVQRVGSGAYLPMLFPGIILAVTSLIYFIYQKNKTIGLILLLTISVSNIYLVYLSKYFEEKPFGYVFSLSDEIKASQKILKLAKNDKYNLTLKSQGKLINYSVANYEYLTWWLGNNPPVTFHTSKQIIVFKGDNAIKVSLSEK